MNKYILFTLVLTLGLISGCTAKKALLKPDGASEPVLEADKNQALELFKQGSALLWQDNAQALAKFNEAIKRDPTLVAAYFNAGVAQEALGDSQLALSYYERCLAVDKQQSSCLENLVILKHKLGLDHEALDILKTYESNFPEGIFVKVAQAKLAYLMGDPAAAESYARSAIELDAENIEALYIMARLFYDKKSYAAAKWVVKNALEYAPSHGGLYLLLGHINQAMGLLADALDAYASAAKYYPSEEALESYGLLLLRRGRLEESLAVLKRLCEQWPENYRHWLHVGNAYMALKNFEEAKKAYLKARELKPDDKDLDFNLGLLYLDLQPENMSELERYKTSQTYFKNYLEHADLSAERKKEVEEYLDNLSRKIEIAESAAQPVIEEPEPKLESDAETPKAHED